MHRAESSARLPHFRRCAPKPRPAVRSSESVQRGTGWDVQEEEDSIVIHQVHHDDWHRVEQSIRRFDQVATALEREGWIERTDAAAE